MFTVTLKDLRKAGACYEGYNKVVRMLQSKPFTEEDASRVSYIRFRHDKPVSLIEICKNNGIDDALWSTRCISGHDRDLRLFAVWCARQVQHLMTDERSLNALDVAEQFANGKATQEELAAAWEAAWEAAWGAAWEAAWEAAREAAWGAAREAAWEAARVAQSEMFIAMCEGRAPWQGEQ